MPIVWRYLLRHFFQVFLLCMATFVGMLLVLRFQEIARFVASGAPKLTVILFMLYQIPYILPLAIPVSCLIAAILLFQNLSHMHELSAFRTCGLGLKSIIAPILFAGGLLCAVNFIITCEMAPRCRGLSKEMIYGMAATNPLFLLQKESLIKLKNAFVDMRVLKAGKYAEHVLLATKNTSTERLALLSAQRLTIKNDLLKGDNVVVISSADSKLTNAFDHLIIENQTAMDTKSANLTQFVQTSDWHSNYEYLPLRLIFASEQLDGGPHLGKAARIEIARRISLSLAAFSFTCIGAVFGIEIGRNRSKKNILWALSLAALFLVSFVAAKSFKHSPSLAMAIYLLVHPIILFFCIRTFRTTDKGIE